MKYSNFERVEKVQGDLRVEQVVVHRKRRHGYWGLKIWSILLAFLIWLVMANIDGASNAPSSEQEARCPDVEQTVL